MKKYIENITIGDIFILLVVVSIIISAIILIKF